MENASKALMMAGSVLLSVLIITALVFLYNNVIDLKRTESLSEETKKLYEYNKKIEMFNKQGLYGSEILSLSNLIEDYNRTQNELKEYNEIKLQIEIKEMPSAYYFKERKYRDYKCLNEKVNQLNDDINILKTTKLNQLYNNRKIEIILRNGGISVYLNKLNNNKYSNLTLDKISNMRENEKLILFENDTDAYDVASNLSDFYVNIKNEFTQFKNKKFQQPEVTYDKNNGRIENMTFKEIGL